MRRRNPLVAYIFLLIIILLAGYFFLSSGEENEVSPKEEDEITSKDASSNTPATSEWQTFASDRLGVSFSYPAAWTASPAEDETNLFLLADPTCVSQCSGIFVERLKVTDAPDRYIEVLKQGGTSDVVENEFFVATKQFPKIYTKRDVVYQFTLNVSNSAAVFEKILETFKELPRVDIAKTPSPAGPEYRFASCGTMDAYREQVFASDLLAKIATLSRYRMPKLVQQYGLMKMRPEDVTDACYSEVGAMVIGLVPGKPVDGAAAAGITEVCERGDILKYDTTQGNIMAVDYGSMEGCFWLSKLGKRQGRFILIEGGMPGKAQTIFRYDYVRNTLYSSEDVVPILPTSTAQPT